VPEELSRPATLEDLKALLRSLNAHGVDYLLIGGYALAAHGYPRATTDIDVVFPATASAGHLVKNALMILPDQAAKELEPAWFEEGENIRVADAFVVDIMLNANGQTYETLRTYSQTIELDGIPVQTVSLEGLLLTKKTMREKDVADRLVIERAIARFRESEPDKNAK
jgi:predicted nucleotidyltransferase